MDVDRGPERILDEYLVVMSQAGSREALGRLVVRWSPRLLRYSARTLGTAEGAEDVVQETWSAALRALPQLQDSARFPPWIYAIATRKCADLVRRQRRASRTEDRLAVQQAVNGHAVGPAGEAGLDLTAALRRLPMDQKLTVSLHYGEDLAVEEVAAVLGVPAGTVKSRLHTARRALKLILEGSEP